MTKLDPDATYAQRSGEVTAKVFDDEVLIINLSSGTYYSIEGTGRGIWRALVAGQSVAAIERRLHAAFGVDRQALGDDLRAFVGDLVAEGLLAPRPGGNGGDAAEPEDFGDAYQAPRLERFDDLESILALDPPMPDADDLALGSADDKPRR